MPLAQTDFWTAHLHQTLQRYDEGLLRQVAARLIKPRGQWPAEELIERMTAVVSNAAVIDRRIGALEPACRRLLAVIGHSRQPRWNLGSLIELLVALGHEPEVRPVLAWFDSGLLYPDLPPSELPLPRGVLAGGRLKSFEQSLGHFPSLTVFSHPHVTARALREDLGLPDLSDPVSRDHAAAPREADGLEWPLRLAVLWQQIASAPLRRTQGGQFFKRDLDRLRADPLLTGPPADNLADLPDPGLLAVALGLAEGLLQDKAGDIEAAPFPPAWEEGVPAVLASMFSHLPQLNSWSPLDGWCGNEAVNNPYASAQLLALLLLARLPHQGWAQVETAASWVVKHHPNLGGNQNTVGVNSEHANDNSPPTLPHRWGEGREGGRVRAAQNARRAQMALTSFLLGLAFQLRMVQAEKSERGGWLVRLGPMGRWLLGLAEAPPASPTYPQTLLVQPNLEVLVYRQGLTPELIGQLSQFAAWKTLGSACTVQLQPETVYRALEAGMTYESILQTLERQGMRPTPPAVIEALRTWAGKRERLGVYASATLFEFATPADLSDALARGLPGVRIAERLAVVANEKDIDFRNYRLTATRDYGLPPEKCIDVEEDGVTLTVDMSRSDLLLETELERFSEPVRAAMGRRQYRMTPDSLAACLDNGPGLNTLEEWFQRRTGRPLTPAARLLLNGNQIPPVEVRQQHVLFVDSEETADGLLQWPATRALIQSRLGPRALAIAEENLKELRKLLASLGVKTV